MSNLNESLTFRHGATVVNRFVQAPMLTNSGEDGFATQDTIDYYHARSHAGGMIVTEYMYVDENGGPALTWRRGREQLAVYDDKFVPQLTKVAAAIKHSGNKAILQLCHVGREANFRAMNGKPVYAPSAIDFPFLPYKVHAFSEEQIEKLETRNQEIDTLLTREDIYSNSVKCQELAKEKAAISEELAELYEKWEGLAE